MIIGYSKRFNKNFQKRIAPNSKLVAHFLDRLQIFSSDPGHSLLKLHKLSGQLDNLYSFSVTGDIRVLFEKISDNEVMLRDIGSHNQVY